MGDKICHWHRTKKLHERGAEGTHTSHRLQDDFSRDMRRGGNTQQETQMGVNMVACLENHTQATTRTIGILRKPQGLSKKGAVTNNSTGRIYFFRDMVSDGQEDITKESNTDDQHRGNTSNKWFIKGNEMRPTKEVK